MTGDDNGSRQDSNIDDAIIKYSVGIGSSFEEAAAALAKAKVNKGRLDNIVQYSGEKIEDKDFSKNSNAMGYKRILKFLHEKEAGIELLEDHAALAHDPKTGLLNKLGYDTARLELIDKGMDEGYFILLDGDFLHDHNEEKGYSVTDQYIAATGAAINAMIDSTRNRLDKRTGDRVRLGRRKENSREDIIGMGHRLNDSGGDEFLIYLPITHSPSNQKIAQMVAQRVLNHVYDSQRVVAEVHYNNTIDPSQTHSS